MSTSARHRNPPQAAPAASPRVLSRADLAEAVRAEFPNAVVGAAWNLRYAVVGSWQFDAGKFPGELALHLAALRGGKSDFAAAFDCDAFAEFAKALVRVKHAVAWGYDTAAPDGVAFGMLAYSIGGEAGRGHAVNILLTERGVGTWEPQTGKFTVLTDAEKASAWLAQF